MDIVPVKHVALADVAKLQQEVNTLRQEVYRLQQAQRQFQTLANRMPGMLYGLRCAPDRTDLLLYVSSGCEALLEVDAITLQADPQLLWRVIHPDDRELVMLTRQNAAINVANWIHDWRIITPSGRHKWVSGTAHPDPLPDGATLWFGYMVDVSDRYAALEQRKQAEAETKAQQQIYKAILDNVPHRVWYKDADSRYIAVNEAFCQAVNLTPDDLIGKSEYEVWPLEQAQMFIETDQAAIASGKPYYMERCIPLADGSYHWVMTIKTPVYDDAGNVLGTTGISMDITSRKQAELTVQQLNTELEARVHERTAALQNALSESQALNAILDNLVDGLLVTNTEGRVIRYNPAFVNMFALVSHDFLHQNCQQLALPDLANLIDQLQQFVASHGTTDRLAMTSNYVVTAEVALCNNRIGQAVASLIFKQTADDDAMQWLGCAVLIRDVTHEREVDRVKNEFIATVSHELRTPLTSVLGFASIIRDKLNERVFPLLQSIRDRASIDKTVSTPVGSTVADQSRLSEPLNLLRTTLSKIDANLAIIVDEAERLTLLINDLLDIAKMEADEADWYMEPVSPAEVANWAIHATSGLFETGNLVLQQAIDPNLPDVLGDQNRLIQVMINLISNAVKFTAQGTITVQVALESDLANSKIIPSTPAKADSRLTIVFSVIDTGIGIAPENHHKVFERFQQLGDMLTDKPRGTGLGLAICKQIVERHGGHIWVESEVGVGSTFAFALPAISPETQLEAIVSIDDLIKQLRQQGY